MKKSISSIIIAALILASCGEKNQKVTITTASDSLSYAIGTDIGKSFERSKLDSLNIDLVAKGMKNYLAKDSSVMNEETVNKILAAFSKKRREAAEKERTEKLKIQYKDNLEAGEKFLAENAKKEGVITLPDGLQYKIIKEGTGNTPKATDKVQVDYEGRLIDGTVFDSSYERGEPAEFNVTGVIKGWTEALQLMKEGSVWELYIPYDLAYGSRQAGKDIKPFSTLIFKVKLHKIVK